MKKINLFVLALFTLMACKQSDIPQPTSVEIKDNWYYLNGEKFFIKGIGYELGARPGQHPYHDGFIIDFKKLRHDSSDLDLLKHDIKVIKDAGFNTIRTWKEFSEPQLKVIQESGLKVIMGIAVWPIGPYSDTAFQREVEERVTYCLKYSKNYDCIISYLILNEPMTHHIYNHGSDVYHDLFNGLKELIHTQHPGVPVSISYGAVNSSYLDLNMMDFYALNNYDYGRRQHTTMGYRGFLQWFMELNNYEKPLIATEFGYAVNPIGAGGYTNSGNLLEEQSKGVLKNYRDFLDAGATGACPFNYSDGWWKSGEAGVHNDDKKEEWYGLIGYGSFSDTLGTPRPAWYALKNYIKAIVLSPKNDNIYERKIPVELYVDKDVDSYIVKFNDRIVLSKKVLKEGYLIDSLEYNPEEKEAVEFVFEFLDKSGEVIKSEVITALVVDKPVALPKIAIETTPDINLAESKTLSMKVKISNPGGFEIVSDLNYNFIFHIGWDEGIVGTIEIPEEDRKKKELVFERTITVPDASLITIPSAGISIKYNKFKMRLSDKKILVRDYWTNKIGLKCIQPEDK